MCQPLCVKQCSPPTTQSQKAVQASTCSHLENVLPRHWILLMVWSREGHSVMVHDSLLNHHIILYHIHLVWVLTPNPYKSHLIYAYSSIWKNMGPVKIIWRKGSIMQTAMPWVPAVTYTVCSWCRRSTLILPVIRQETFPTLFCNPPTVCSWQHLAFIVVKYHFTQSAQGHNGTLFSTRRQVLNTMHKIVNTTQADSRGRRKCFPVSPVQV